MLLKNKSLLAGAVIAIFLASCAKETAVDSSDTSGNSYCLLYTSPSPRDGHQSRMPSSA